MIAVYALDRAMYADDEAEYLARPANYREAVEARRRLAAAEIALSAQISTLLRVGSSAAAHAVEVAVGLIERLPQVFALIGENVISPKAAELALSRSRVLSADQVREFDAALHDRLTVEYEVLSIPALRDEVDLLVSAIDPEAEERRRRLAEQDRRVTFRRRRTGWRWRSRCCRLRTCRRCRRGSATSPAPPATRIRERRRSVRPTGWRSSSAATARSDAPARRRSAGTERPGITANPTRTVS